MLFLQYPPCSTCQKAKKWLDDHGIEYTARLLIFSTAAEKRINIRELVSVLAISLLGLLITEGLLYVGTDMLKMDFRLSKIIASVIVLFWNYFARKIVVYK